MNKQKLSKEEKTKIELVQNFFNYSKSQRIRDVLQNKLSAAVVDYNYVLIENEICYIFCGKLSKDKVVEIIKNSAFEKFNILCSDVENGVKEFVLSIKNYNIQLIDAKTLVIKYHFNVEEKDCSIQFLQKQKLNLKEFFKLFIKEENAKGYLVTSIILMISTLIIKMKIYYYIVISVLLILAFFCKALPKIKNDKKL